jgi:hypothetical protein
MSCRCAFNARWKVICFQHPGVATGQALASPRILPPLRLRIPFPVCRFLPDAFSVLIHSVVQTPPQPCSRRAANPVPRPIPAFVAPSSGIGPPPTPSATCLQSYAAGGRLPSPAESLQSCPVGGKLPSPAESLQFCAAGGNLPSPAESLQSCPVGGKLPSPAESLQFCAAGGQLP